MTRRHATLAAVAAATLGAPAAAVERPLWELGAGAGVLRLPHYRGSDQSHTWLLPVPYVVYRGEIFKADRDGARAVLFESDRLDFDLSVAASAPTRSEDNRARAGMADLDPTLEFGPNVNWTLARDQRWKLDLRLPLRAALTLGSSPRTIGWTAHPNLNLDVARVAGGWNFGLQAGPVYASRRYNAYYYDVAPAEATAARPAYAARSGYGGAQITAALSRRYANTWAGIFVRQDSLRGAQFEDSPLVRRRSNLSFGFALTWVFATSDRMVDVAE